MPNYQPKTAIRANGESDEIIEGTRLVTDVGIKSLALHKLLLKK